MPSPSWLQLMLQLRMSSCIPIIFFVLSRPSASEAAYDKGVKSGVCPATHTSPFDVFREDAAVASDRAITDSLPFNEEEDGDYSDDDDDDTLEEGGKEGLASLLSALVGKGGIGDLGSKVGDVLADTLGGSKEAAALKEAMQGLSTLVGGGAGSEDGFRNSDIESLFKAAAGPLLSGGDSDFLDKLQNLVSRNSPEIKSLLDELVSNPYMDVEEISMPPITADVYTTKASTNENLRDSLKDTVMQPVLRPKPVVLEKIKRFAEAPEELPTASNENEGCHVLVLSGAGVKGAFQAGAVVGLAEQYKASGKELRWDVVSGVSFGGVAAAFSLPFEPGRNGELDYGRSLWSFWRNLRFEDILKCKEGMRDLVDIPATLKWVRDSYKLWKSKDMFSTLGTAHSCDPSPYTETLRKQLTRHVDTSDGEKGSCADRRTVTLTAAILGGGEKKFTFTSADVDGNCEASKLTKSGTRRIDLVLTAMLATSAMPGIFPLVKFTSVEARRQEREDEDNGDDMRGQERKRNRRESEEKERDVEDANARVDKNKRDQRESEEKERDVEDANARVDKNKRDQTPTDDTYGLEEPLSEVTEKYVLVDGSLTSYLNITPAIRACQEKLTKVHRLQQLGGNYSKGKTATTKEHQPATQEDEFLAKEISEGKGIVFDFIVANEIGTSTTDENLEELFDSEDDVFDNAASPLFNIKTLAESLPRARIRHVISYEDPAEVAHDVMDLRSVAALLEHGRVAGWKAATLKSVRAGRD